MLHEILLLLREYLRFELRIGLLEHFRKRIITHGADDVLAGIHDRRCLEQVFELLADGY